MIIFSKSEFIVHFTTLFHRPFFVFILFTGRDPEVLARLGNWKIVYEISLVVWIIFGLGYIFMIITIITDSMRKPARSAAKRFRKAEKVMVTRILDEILEIKAKKVRNHLLKMPRRITINTTLFKTNRNR